jgi:hypothetical protein
MTFGKEAGDSTSAALLGILGTGSERSLRADVSIRNDTPGTLFALFHAVVAVGCDET